jgi:hypothetical protein
MDGDRALVIRNLFRAEMLILLINAVFPHTHVRPGLILSVESLEIRVALCLARYCHDRLITKTCPSGTLRVCLVGRPNPEILCSTENSNNLGVW